MTVWQTIAGVGQCKTLTNASLTGWIPSESLSICLNGVDSQVQERYNSSGLEIKEGTRHANTPHTTPARSRTGRSSAPAELHCTYRPDYSIRHDRDGFQHGLR